jgi:hypothetical protein
MIAEGGDQAMPTGKYLRQTIASQDREGQKKLIPKEGLAGFQEWSEEPGWRADTRPLVKRGISAPSTLPTLIGEEGRPGPQAWIEHNG